MVAIFSYTFNLSDYFSKVFADDPVDDGGDSSTSNLELQGDVYSTGDVSGVSIGERSVVTSQNAVNVDSQYKLPNYVSSDDSLLNWTKLKGEMSKIVTRLKNERAKTDFDVSNFSNLNPEGNPDGEVWLINDDMTIGTRALTGKATFIIEGNLTINGDVTYSDEKTSVGFIVEGNIDIAKDVENLRGAYFSTGDINIIGTSQ